MEAKLIKKDNGYYMTHEPTDWYIGDTDHEKVKNFKGEQGLLKLSLKNCQSIENGYDLDELADKYEYVNYKGKSKSYNIGFKHGFQKALEIIGDKKFSSRNMLKAFITGVFTDETSDYDFEFTELMQDLQQTEWDVEIVTHAKENGSYTKEDGFEQEPKLDADGCLILKRKI